MLLSMHGTTQHRRWGIVIGAVLILLLFLSSYVRVSMRDSNYQPFPKLEQSYEISQSALQDLQHVKTKDAVSENSWVNLTDDGLVSITGFLVYSELSFNDHDFMFQDISAASIVVPETIGGVTVYRLIPFWCTEDTVVEILGVQERNDSIDDSLIRERNSQMPREGQSLITPPSPSHYQLVQADLSIHDGWLHADYIGSYWDMFYYDGRSNTSFKGWGFSLMPALARSKSSNLELEDEFLLNVSQDKAILIEGVLVNVTTVHTGFQRAEERNLSLSEGEYVKTYVRIPAKFGSVVTYCFIPVYFLDRSQAYSFLGYELFDIEGKSITIPIRLEGDIFVYAGNEGWE